MGSHRAVRITLGDPGFKPSSIYDRQLIDFGQRIVALLESGKTQHNKFVLATLDDFLGALYALIFSLHNNPPFKFRPHSVDVHVILKRVRAVARSHHVRTKGKWMAGFHINSAMFRLASVYHRSLKIATKQTASRKMIGCESDPGSLIHLAKKTYSGWTGNQWKNQNISDVHKEVNELKHTAEGIYSGRRVSEKHALTAAAELLDLLEAWNLHG